MNTAEMYNNRAKDYEEGRPSYSKKLIDCMYNDFGISKSSVIADIGSGTGKFARLLLEKGSTVFCVEPNKDMRRVAEQELHMYSNFHSIFGEAEYTTLPDNSVDCIVSAQAFHWFDVAKFNHECQRIIRKNGKVFLIWNIEDNHSPINQELEKIMEKYCSDMKNSKGRTNQDKKIEDFFRGQYECISFDYPLFLNQANFISKCLSSSYSLKKGDKCYSEYIQALCALFDKHECDGTITIQNKTVAFIGSVK